MTTKTISLDELLARFAEKELVDAAGAEQIRKYVRASEAAAANPWYIKALLAVGAWIAALCFILFLLAAELFNDLGGLLVWGGLFIGGAVVLHRFAGARDFAAQLALALSVAGHVMMFVWVAASTEEFAFVPLAALLLCVALYPLYKNALHRFLSCLTAAVMSAAWLLYAEMPDGLHLLVLFEIAGVCLLFTTRGAGGRGWPDATRPAAYALAVSLLVTLLLVVWLNSFALANIVDERARVFEIPSKIILAASLLYLCWWVAGKLKGRLTLLSEPLAIAFVAVIALGILSTPGVLAALALVIIGYERHDRTLLSLGVIFFPVFICAFYYALNVDLLTKSLILIGSGLVLLFARWFMGKRAWVGEGERA
ncbi:MAG: DUF4401 domain-containing protein [Pyrinomonadaceae bacterium]|nr:DUF4401 domain-containing protein [Pyrinomonadaceae bacterium]